MNTILHQSEDNFITKHYSKINEIYNDLVKQYPFFTPLKI